MSTARTVAQGLTSAAFLASGGMKLTGGLADEFERFGYPQWFRVAIGAGEVAAAAGLGADLAQGKHRFERPAGALLAATMAGAVVTHLRAGDGLSAAAAPLVLGGLSAWLASGSR